MKPQPFHWLLFLTLLSMVFQPAEAQEPLFRRHLLGEDLENTKVRLVYEAPDGFLWFGSNRGLLQYDGIGFKAFRAPDSLTNNQVSAIFYDSKKRLWIGYEDGAIFFLNNYRRLERWQPEEGNPASPIRGIAEDRNGVLWIATYGEGIYYLHNNRLYNIDTEEGLASNDIYVLSPDKQGKMWLGTDNGISICSLNQGRKQVKNLSKADGLPDEIVRDIVHDVAGNCWIGMNDHGFCYFNTQTNAFSRPIRDWDSGVINGMALFENRDLWIATEGNGLWRYSLEDQVLKKNSDSEKKLRNAKIYDLHRDIEGNLWVINNIEGICSANLRFEYITTPFDNIQALLRDGRKRLWAGTPNGLFVRENSADSQFSRVTALPDKANIVSLYEDRYHHIWIGTYDKGVYCYDFQSKAIRNFDEKGGLTTNSVISISGLGDQLWLATFGGVTSIVLKGDPLNGGEPDFHNLNYESGLGANFIYKSFVDRKGRTWFGTDGKGLSVLENGKITSYTHAGNTRLGSVYSIAEDDRGHIWISTDKEGIFEFDGQQFMRLSVKEGLRKMIIMSLAANSHGDLLLTHDAGIDILDPVTKHLIYYDDEVGISKAEPNLNAFCTDDQHNVWMGFGNQIIEYCALNDTLAIHPRTLLKNVSIFLDPVDFEAEHRFSYNQNNLVFEYTGLWYTDPEAVRYRYKLEGFNHDWIESADLRAVYPNLPPGDYTFVVASTENAAFDDEPEVRYTFTILPPFWMRWWFVLLMLILGTLVARYFIRLRDKRLQQAALLKKEKIESQYEALKSQINPHFLFNSFNTLITIIEENPTMAVEYVETLSDFYRSILQYREKEVIPLEEELELVRNYVFLLKKRYGHNFNLRIECDASAKLSILLPPLTLQMLVENAVKHNVISKGKKLDVVISVSPDGRYLVVSNNLQRKMTAEKSTGFGLQSIARRYELLTDSKIIIEETEDAFRVRIPLIKNVKDESSDHRR
ncbi:MAG: histidine kinase [Saprospiraceae bacterium]|nr:histidine kinase [Saprospiraceae bacterium]